MLLTRSPLRLLQKQASSIISVRLACIRHAASVHPEPGSNSPFVCLSLFLNTVSFLYSVFSFFIRTSCPSFFELTFPVWFSKINRTAFAVCFVILPLPFSPVNPFFSFLFLFSPHFIILIITPSLYTRIWKSSLGYLMYIHRQCEKLTVNCSANFTVKASFSLL